MSWNEGAKAFIAGADIEARRRVKLKSGTTTTPPEVVHAGAGEDFIGVSEYAVKSGQSLAVRLANSPGTQEVEATVTTAIAVGTTLYGAANGTLGDDDNGGAYTAQATALSAAAATGQHIEVLLS